MKKKLTKITGIKSAPFRNKSIRFNLYGFIGIILTVFLLSSSGFSAVSLSIVQGGITGVIIDQSNARIANAAVTLSTSNGTIVGETVTNSDGEFELADIPNGNYVLTVDARGWAKFRTAVAVNQETPVNLAITLSPSPIEDQVTVTASSGEAFGVFEFPKQITSSSAEELLRRPANALPQALRESPSVHVQQTTTSQGSVFLRGLTGQRVVSLIDGVRYNNSTFRPGPNQFLATVPLQSADNIEVVSGPASVQYGSDGLGGTINVLTSRASFSNKGTKLHGQATTRFGSADLSGGGDLKLTLGNERFSAIVGGSFLRTQDVRPGGGLDSHSVVTRFFGISSKILGERLQDTAFTQYGGEARLYFRPGNDQQISLAYLRNELRGNRRYDQLNGGNGNLVNDFIPQVLDFFYLRYEKLKVGFFDSVTGTFSLNRQRDDRRTQGGSGNPLANITKEFNLVNAYGYNLQATTHFTRHSALLLGAELYDEYTDSSAFVTNPASGVVTIARGRFPDNGRYKTFGFYAENHTDLIPSRVRFTAGVRYGASQFKAFSADNPIINGLPTVIDSSVRQDAVTFNLGVSVTPTEWLALYGTVNRGFRAPNINDLGGIGISSNGFSITAEQAAPLGGEIGSSAGATAVSTGMELRTLDPESVLNYEAGIKVRRNRFDIFLNGYLANLSDVTAVRAVVFPSNVVGQSIGGQTIISQSETGTAFVSGVSQPIIARVNAGRVRFWGINAGGRILLTPELEARAHGFYLRSRDLEPSPQADPPPGVILIRRFPDAPDFEGGLPPATGFFSLKYQPQASRYWVEVYSNLANKQDRLSSVDLDDQRQGATRSRSNIASFFRNGAVARNLINSGNDGIFGTGDDILAATGETLAQIQDRVLGQGIISAPFFLSTPGYATLNFRGGLRFGERSDLIFILENLLDKNYRIHGSGTDQPGINLTVRYLLRF